MPDHVAGALESIRVIDFGHYIAGPLAAMLLADHGAEVIHIDRPGAATSEHRDAYYNRGKQRVTLDLKTPEGLEEARRLVAGADVLIENFRPGVMDRLGLGASTYRRNSPRLIYCSLPGFAADDARARCAAWEGVVLAATSGYRPLAAHYYAEHAQIAVEDATRPLFTPIPLASNIAAMTAAVAIVMALIARRRTGMGQWIEVPLAEAMIEPLSMYIERPMFGTAPVGSTVGKYKCADGRFVDWTGHPARFLEWLVDDVGLGSAWRADGLLDRQRAAEDPDLNACLQERLRQLFLTKDAEEWESIAIRLEIPLVLVRTPQEWMSCDHARASRSVVRVEDPLLGKTDMAGMSISLSASPAIARPRQVTSQARSRFKTVAKSADCATDPAAVLNRPLHGISVVDLTTQIAGPTGARILAEYGARVVKINHPQMRSTTKYINTGKSVLSLDIAKPLGLDILWRLLDSADVVCQNFALGWTDAHGLGWEQVSAKHPRMVYSSVSLFAYDGPWGARRGYEMQGQAATGLASRYGGEGQWPLNQPLLLNDTGTGLLAAFAVSLAILERYETGTGQHVNASLSQTATLHQAAQLVRPVEQQDHDPSGLRIMGWSALQRLYRANDRWLFVGAQQGQIRTLLSVVCQDQDQLHVSLEDSGEHSALALMLETAFRANSASSWVDRLQSVGIGAHVVLTQAEVEANPIYKKKGLIEEIRLSDGTLEKRPGAGRWFKSMNHDADTAETDPPQGAHEILLSIGYGDRLKELELAAVTTVTTKSL